jgi:hypothetical protein
MARAPLRSSPLWEGMALILGIDRFMNEARALVNMIGNGVAAIVMAKWEGELDEVRPKAALSGDLLADTEAVDPAGYPLFAKTRSESWSSAKAPDIGTRPKRSPA